jgi:hypothetical protein
MSVVVRWIIMFGGGLRVNVGGYVKSCCGFFFFFFFFAQVISQFVPALNPGGRTEGSLDAGWLSTGLGSIVRHSLCRVMGEARKNFARQDGEIRRPPPHQKQRAR